MVPHLYSTSKLLFTPSSPTPKTPNNSSAFPTRYHGDASPQKSMVPFTPESLHKVLFLLEHLLFAHGQRREHYWRWKKRNYSRRGFSNNQQSAAVLAAVGKIQCQAATLQRCHCNSASRNSPPAFSQHLISEPCLHQSYRAKFGRKASFFLKKLWFYKSYCYASNIYSAYLTMNVIYGFNKQCAVVRYMHLPAFI